MSRLAILVCGASGTGKSTLVNNFKNCRWPLGVVTSTTSQLVAEYGGWEAVRTDNEKRTALQRAIYDLKETSIKEAVESSIYDFIVDRFLDCAVYAQQECFAMEDHRLQVEQAKGLIGWMYGRGVVPLIVFVRPNEFVLSRAREADGGRRSEYLETSRVWRVDGGIEQALTMIGEPFVSLDSPSLKDRVGTIEALLLQAKRLRMAILA